MGSLFLLSPLLLYFPKLIPGIETQPWLAVGFAVWAFACDRSCRGLFAAAGVMATAGLLGLIIWAVGGVQLTAGLATLQFAVGPVLLCGALAWKPVPPSRRCVAGVALVLAALAAFELLLPSVYRGLATLLLDRVNVSDGHRGVSLLTPEPTYAAISLAYALLLTLWSRRCWGKDHAWVEYLLAGLLLLTFSTYALLLLLALAFLYRPALTLLAMLCGGFLGYGYLAGGGGTEGAIRAVVALSRLLTVDSTAILTSLSLIDPSVGYRVTSITASLATVWVHPLGFGLGCESVAQAFSTLGWDFVFDDEVIGPAIYSGSCLKPSSFLTSVLLAYGMLSAFLLLAIVFAVAYLQKGKQLRIWWPALGWSLIILLVQCQITSPIPWFMLYMAMFPLRAVRVAIVVPVAKSGAFEYQGRMQPHAG